jgi:hypothetical protein
MALAIVATALAATASAFGLQGWRTPDDRLYFGAESPPDSAKIDAVDRPLTQASAPTEKILAPAAVTGVPPPAAATRHAATAEPTRPPRSAATPASPVRRSDPPAARQRGSGPENELLRLDAPVVWRREPACGNIVAIRDARPTIDFEADRLTMSGEVFVTTGGPVKDVRVCLAGSCALVDGGKILADGDTARFTLTVSGRRPRGLTVECFVQRRP